VAARSGDDRQAHHHLLQRLAFSETRHNWDIFLANTMAYDREENGGEEAALILSLVGLWRRWTTRMRMTVVAGGNKQQPTP